MSDFRVHQKSITPMAAFSAPFRLYRRQEIILPGGNMRSMFIFGAGTLLAALALAQSHYTVTDLGTLGGPGSPSRSERHHGSTPPLPDLIAAVRAQSLEGLVAKRLDSSQPP
jgi:hypothetical protein